MVSLFDFSECLDPDQKTDSGTEKNLLENGQAMHQQPTGTGTGIEQAIVSQTLYYGTKEKKLREDRKSVV